MYKIKQKLDITGFAQILHTLIRNQNSLAEILRRTFIINDQRLFLP